MRKHWLVTLLAVLPFVVSSARTWTDIQGRTIEADIVRAGDGHVTVKLNDHEVNIPPHIPRTKLSAGDRGFVADWQDKQCVAAPADTTRLAPAR